MSDRKIYSQLVALTKEIRLREPRDGAWGKVQFLAGNNGLDHFRGVLGITWWYSERASQICRAVASRAMLKHPELQYGDAETLAKVIQEILQKNCLNSDLFNGDDIFFHGKENLFEARSIQNVESFYKKLWDYIFEGFKESIMHWCVVYPLPRVKSNSFDLEYEGILLINREDENIWNTWIKEKFCTEDLNINTGLSPYSGETVFSKLKYESLLVCKCNGTEYGAKFNAALQFREFLSVLFSAFSTSENYILMKSSADPIAACIQFPQIEKRARQAWIISEIGHLIRHCSRDPGFDMDMASDHFYTTGSNHFSRGANNVWTG